MEVDSLSGADTGKRRCRPFVKWVGGKNQLLDELLARIPADVKRYYEPFLGGGALFFAYQPKLAYVSDANADLINAYDVVKNDVEALIKDLRRHVHDEERFYKIRNIDRSPEYAKWSPVRKASRLIYLNKTCYNGLYRVNSKGYFNTPFGRYVNPKIVDEDNLRACSAALRKVTIKKAGFEEVAKKLTADDFVYFDPPYVPLSTTAYFTKYSSDGFGLELQRALFDLCCRLDKRGIRFMLSNSSAEFVRTLYKQFRVELVSANRAVNSKAERRGKIHEVIVRNY